MAIKESLKKIHDPWIERISRELASGEGVRVGFEEQLVRFYGLLEQTIMSADIAWLDPILYDWGHASTQTNLEEGDYFVSFVINRMVGLTIEIARETLKQKEALELLAAIIPILTHSLSVVIRYEMEARVAYISTELNNTQDKLQQLDRNKSNFISVAAHELKTPLTLIEGYTTMMLDQIEQSQSPINGYLNGVNNGILRLRHILDAMIDVSLIDSNLLILNYQPLWISHLLNLLQNELKISVSERKLNLIIKQFEGCDLMIYGDSARLYQALHNVASNAIKYTPDEGTITLDGRLLPGFIEITITDTGIGISPEHQPTLFKKFGQLGQSNLHSSGKTKFKGGGPGLGLSITRGILEAHGGTIWVESEGFDEVKLKGTTFHILLPTRTEPTDPTMKNFFGKFEQPKSKQESEMAASVKKNHTTHHPSA